MIKTTYSTMLLVIGFLALMLMSPSAHLMAQTAEVRSSVTNSTAETPPAEEHGSVTSPTNSTRSVSFMSFTTDAQAAEEHHCVSHCRHHYEERLRECSEPSHEHHHRCEEWAREREKECLEKCYHEYPR
jgi:hypothetical protein